MVVVVELEVERVACTWEVVKLLLLTGLATVEDRELRDVELLVVGEDIVLVAANNLLVDAAVVLVGEDVVGPGTEEKEVGAAWAAWYLAARMLSRFLLLSLFLFLGR